MRGPGVSSMLSRGRDRNSDTFSPDDLHDSFRYAEQLAVSSTRSCLINQYYFFLYLSITVLDVAVSSRCIVSYDKI